MRQTRSLRTHWIPRGCQRTWNASGPKLLQVLQFLEFRWISVRKVLQQFWGRILCCTECCCHNFLELQTLMCRFLLTLRTTPSLCSRGRVAQGNCTQFAQRDWQGLALPFRSDFDVVPWHRCLRPNGSPCFEFSINVLQDMHRKPSCESNPKLDVWWAKRKLCSA